MERVKDAQVIRLIERIGDHYRSNILNRFLRPVLLQLQVDKTTWDLIEILTEKMELYRYQGFHFDDLYRQIAACARFVETARSSSIIKNKINSLPASHGHDKILRDMAVSNFASNLQVFAGLLCELYVNLVELDESSAGKNKPIYTQIPELYSVENLLARN